MPSTRPGPETKTRDDTVTRQPAASKDTAKGHADLGVEVVKSQVADAELVQRRREQIAAAAAELFSKDGFYRTTVQQIARKCGFSSGLIYQYAETKEDVLLLALLHVMSRFRREIEQAHEVSDLLERVFVALDAYCRVVDQFKAAAMLAYRSTMSLPLEYRSHIKNAEIATNELIAVRVRDCIDAGLFRKVNVDLVTYQLVLHAHAWSLKYWRFGKLISLEDYVAHGFDMFVQALVTERGRQAYEGFLAARKTVARSKQKAPRTRTPSV